METYSLLVIIDDIYFASDNVLRKINENLNKLKEKGKEEKFGGIPIFFASDFTLLDGTSLFKTSVL